mgnify:CR=1 FL=1
MKDFSRDISVKEMRIMDQNTNDYGVPFGFLMECAGSSAARAIYENYKNEGLSSALILCGTGNNGGDGFVIARHLVARQIQVHVVLIGNPLKIRSEHARLNWEIVNRLKLNITVSVVKDSSKFHGGKLMGLEAGNYDVIVDCLLGTGIKGEIREPAKSAINYINQAKSQETRVVAIDVPSGMDPDDGSVSDITVEPDLLLTFHRKKAGFNSPDVSIPKIEVCSIGIPQDADRFVGSGDLKYNMRRRNDSNHKGQHGKVLVIGGSEEYSGAPALSGMAALQMDMDLVIVYSPRPIAAVIRGYSPNLIVREGKGSNICPEDLPVIEELIEWADSVVMGPGMGLAHETKEAVGMILSALTKSGKPVVIDADGLKMCKDYKDELKGCKAVLTPHAGEFKILTSTKLPPEEKYSERARILELVAQKFSSTFLVKGRLDYICDEEQTRINKTGVPQMAVGGTGDILTGIIASLLALRIDKFNAACVAAYISGRLGEKYLEIYGSTANPVKNFKSSDLLEIIPMVISESDSAKHLTTQNP